MKQLNILSRYPALSICLFFALLFSNAQTKAQCNAVFTYSINHTTKTVTFNNTSTAYSPSPSFYWYFASNTWNDYSTVKNPVTTFPGNGTYLVCLSVMDSTCYDSLCMTITINDSLTTGMLKEAESNEVFSSWPNPFTDRLHLGINSLANESATFVLTDLMGRVHLNSRVQLHSGFNREQYDLSSLLPGVYLLELRTDTQRLVRRVLK